jgi:hypothetical protein
VRERDSLGLRLRERVIDRGRGAASIWSLSSPEHSAASCSSSSSSFFGSSSFGSSSLGGELAGLAGTSSAIGSWFISSVDMVLLDALLSASVSIESDLNKNTRKVR